MQGKGPDDLDYICIVFPVVSTSLAEWLQYILDSNFICQLHEAAASHWRDPKMLKSSAVFLLELLSSPVLSQQLLMSPYCHVEELSGMKLAPDPPWTPGISHGRWTTTASAACPMACLGKRLRWNETPQNNLLLFNIRKKRCREGEEDL